MNGLSAFARWRLRCIAALVAAAFLAPLLAGGPRPLLLAELPLLAYAAFALVQAVRLRPSRRDPYDLSRLWDSPPDEPQESDQSPELVYCHVCGASCPAAYALCPECGNRLRG